MYQDFIKDLEDICKKHNVYISGKSANNSFILEKGNVKKVTRKMNLPFNKVRVECVLKKPE